MLGLHSNPADPAEVFLLLAIDHVEQFPARLELPTRYFSALLCCDGNLLTDAAFERIANTLINWGLVGFAAWGPGCQQVETSMDRVMLARENHGERQIFIPTTSHADESLEDALFFLGYCLIPAEADVYAQWGTRLVITVGNEEWSEQIRRCLSRLGQPWDQRFDI